jgi:hypothetical protein
MPLTKTVKVGDLLMGGEWPVSVQTMWKDPLPVFSGPDDPRLPPVIEKMSS